MGKWGNGEKGGEKGTDRSEGRTNKVVRVVGRCKPLLTRAAAWHVWIDTRHIQEMLTADDWKYYH